MVLRNKSAFVLRRNIKTGITNGKMLYLQIIDFTNEQGMSNIETEFCFQFSTHKILGEQILFHVFNHRITILAIHYALLIVNCQVFLFVWLDLPS